MKRTNMLMTLINERTLASTNESNRIIKSNQIAMLILSVSVLLASMLFASICLGYTNDYPYPTLSPLSIDPWGFYYRECVSFVAWRMNRDAGTTQNPYAFKADMNDDGMLDWKWAKDWDDYAILAGITVDNVPEVGSIAKLNQL